MLRFGLLGEKLSHSFSPQIHAELGGYEYRLYEKKPEEVEDFLLHGNFDGLNVTIPYKKTVIPFCAGLSETARLTGSVNTLVRSDDGSLYGHNTDFFGISYLMQKAKMNPVLLEGKTIILGSGGSSVTVQAALQGQNAREVIVVSRTGEDNYENLEKHCNAKWIINTTPVGMYPNNGVSPIPDLKIFSECCGVIDLIYNPARTELMLQAQDAGIPAFNGLAMLVAQAKNSAEYFTGTLIPDVEIERVVSKIASQSLNIVLIGMPGCGKTSIGAALAKKTGRELIDTDELIAQSAGKPIPAIFAEGGEEKFRALETGVLQTVCKQSGKIIATGGGTVTRNENRHVIRQNGIVVFLERDISVLPVDGRPLSRRDGIETLAAARLPLYRKWSDCTAQNCCIEQTAADILEMVETNNIQPETAVYAIYSKFE
jgi:shikimate dehydrogenase